jgi:hypothetical protein
MHTGCVGASQHFASASHWYHPRPWLVFWQFRQAKKSALDLRNGFFVSPLGQVCAFPLACMAYAQTLRVPTLPRIFLFLRRCLGFPNPKLPIERCCRSRGAWNLSVSAINFNKLSTWLRRHVPGNGPKTSAFSNKHLEKISENTCCPTCGMFSLCGKPLSPKHCRVARGDKPTTKQPSCAPVASSSSCADQRPSVCSVFSSPQFCSSI